LQKVSGSLIESNNIESLYDKILSASKVVLKSHSASIQMFDTETNALRLLASQGFHPDSAKFWQWVNADSGSTCGAALANNRRIIVPDIETCEFMKGTGDLEAYRLSGIRSVQSTPLISRSGKIVGMLSNHWSEVHEPSERELKFLDILSRQAADIIERKWADRALKEGDEQLKKFNTSLEDLVTARTKELVESEKQIVDLNRTLFTMNRELNSLNSELRTFTGVAASNFSETLRHLYINLEMIVTNDARNLSNSGRANLRRAQGAIQKLKLVTDDLISFSKLQDIGRKEIKVDLNKILREAIEEFSNRPHHPPFEFNCDNLPPISGYPQLLSLLFHHLLDNASKFRRGDKGHIINVTCHESVDGEGIPNAEKNTSYTVVTISDNGIGFPPEESEKIFDMFYRVPEKGRYKGSGVGLAICKKVMEMHDGFIRAASIPGGGGDFHCYFPLN
jgi:signal transduction histidine kinase